MFSLSKGSITSRSTLQKLALVAGVVLSTIFISQTFFAPVSAAPNDIVINELMYNPSSDDGNDEYLELYNNTASPIDLEGWCFTSGINLCFTAGVTIGANDYLLISPNIGQTNTTYGVTAVAQYSGSLSNSGETITLRDATNTIVNSITYDDASPWPITPDGQGPSLELNDPLGDTSNPQNWGASIGGPTPGAQNSIFQSEVPVISNVTDPNGIAANTSVDITAEIIGNDINTVELHYKLNFDAEVTLTMYDDGSHNDGAAGDNVYGATIPGQAEGTLIRFKVEAINDNGNTTSPRYDDTQNYHGYYIAKSLTTNAEVLEWFIEDDDYTDMHENHVGDGIYLPSVLVYGDTVYDNALARIKGEYSLTFPKKSFKMKLPKGYTIQFDWDNNDSSLPIDEFHVNGDYTTKGIARTPTAFWAVKEAGMPAPDLAVTRLQRNGDFDGLYIVVDKYETEWREEHGYDDGALYEDGVESVNGDSFDLFNDWRDRQNTDRNDPAQREYVLDDNNIPAFMNYMSLHAIARSHDHTFYSNTFSYRANDTERWEPLFWDMDLLFQQSQKLVSPFDTTPYQDAIDRWASVAIYYQEDLRQAYYRRLRTLADQFYGNGAFLAKYQEINALHADDIALDDAAWPNTDGFIKVETQYDENVIRQNYYQLFAYPKQSWGGIPSSQTDAERQQVQIAEVVSSANNADEFIRLSNSADTAVDISNWFIEGINYRIPAGAVIPAGSSIYILRDDIGYRAGHDPVLVAGRYTTDLSTVPGSILHLKTDQNMEIDSYDY